MEKNESEIFMTMSPFEFDQSPQGWRSLANEGRKLEAAQLIKEYIGRNMERIINPEEDDSNKSLEIMRFHIGQMLALEGPGYYVDAVDAFKLSYYNEEGNLFDAYISATIGFLENDLSKVDLAIETIENSKKESKRSGNLGIVKNFKKAIVTGERDYEKVYSWPRG